MLLHSTKYIKAPHNPDGEPRPNRGAKSQLTDVASAFALYRHVAIARQHHYGIIVKFTDEIGVRKK